MNYIKTALSTLGIAALFQFAAAEEYTFVAPETWYSVDDTKSWSSAPEGAKAGTNLWLGGHTFIIAADQGKNGIVVKTFDGEEFPADATFIFNKGFQLNFENGTSHSFGKIINNAGNLIINAQTQIKIASIALNPADSSTASSIKLVYNTASASYYYNSATDNFLTADIGRVTLNAKIPTSIWGNNQEFQINNSRGKNVNAVVRINGLEGQGSVRNELGDTTAAGDDGSTKIVFSNTSDAKFKGMISDDYGTKTNRIGIVMDGSAKQTLILTGTEQGTVWTRDDKSQVGTTIKNGTLAISTCSDVQLAKIQLDGGKLAVAESINGGKGKLSTTGINWNGGKIALELNDANLSAANIVSESGILQGEAETFVFELDLSAFEADKVFNGDEFQLISSSSGDFGYTDKYDATYIYNGKKIGDSLAYEFFVLNNTLGVKLTGTVPEPATVAAILGAVALAFAAYRRRK